MSIDSINGKKILFFAPSFFNYERMIADKMREMGAEVDLYDVRSISSARDRAIIKISPSFFKRKTIQYYENIIQTNKNKKYDYILIIKCDMTPASILKKFKNVYPEAKLCLYLYDSVRNVPGITKKFKYFDKLHSFDLNDCEKYSELLFRPLFFGDQFRKLNPISEYKYNICFIGTIHSDRYAVIKQVQKIALDRGLNCYWFLYLQSRFIYKFYKLTKNEFRKADESIFSFDKMSAKEIADVVDNSRVVLDIQHPKQTGLTMRTIEMIGMNKKLITTNNNIVNYDFYNPNNIAIVDRNSVVIPEDFFKSEYEPLPNDIYESYSLKSWIYEVLD